MLKKFILCVCILSANIAFGQRYQIIGKVVSEKDSVQISQAIIRCYPDSTSKWCFTDEKGNFKLNNVSKQTQKIGISFIGYKRIYVPVEWNKMVVDVGTVVLPIDLFEISDVIVQSAIPAMIRYGDTTQYNAAAYKLNEEWNALDLVSRFPGFHILNNRLMVNGKLLTKVLLDGKEYTNMEVLKILSSVPASVINNIQSYGKQSDFARLTGFQDREPDAALNIRTKKPLAAKGWLNAIGGDGVNTNGIRNNLYGVAGDGTFDTPVHRLIAEVAICNFDPVAANGFSEIGNAFLSASPPSLHMISDEKKIDLEYGYTKEKLKFSIGGYILDNDDRQSSFTTQNFFPVAGMFNSKTVIQNAWNKDDLILYHLNYMMEWAIHPKHTLTLFGSSDSRCRETRKLQMENALQNADSVNRFAVDEFSEDNSIGTRGTGNWYYKISPEKRTLMTSLSYRILPSEGIRRPLSYTNEVYNKMDMRWESSVADTNLKELRESNNSSYAISFKYIEIMAKKHQLMLDANYISDQNTDIRMSYSYSGVTNDYTLFSKKRSNDSGVGSDSYNAALYYNYMGSKKFSLNTSVRVSHDKQYYNDNFAPRYNIEMNSVVYAGTLDVSKKLTPDSNLKLSYDLSGNRPTLSDLSPIIMDKEPSQIFIGNPYLKNGYDHRFSLRYTNHKKGSLSAEVTLNLLGDAIVRLMEFMPMDRDTVIYAINAPADTVGQGYIPQRGATVTRPENRSGALTVSGNIMYGFYFKPLASNLSFSLSHYYSKANAYDGRDNFIQNHHSVFDFSWSSNVSKNIDFRFDYHTSYVVRMMHGYDNFTTYSNRVSGKFSYTFLKRLRLSTMCGWHCENQSDDRIGSNNLVKVDVSLGFYLSHKRNLLLSVIGDNLLDSGSGIRDFLTDAYFSRSINEGFGRFVAVKLSYKFNSMTKIPKLKKGEKTNSGGFFNN